MLYTIVQLPIYQIKRLIKIPPIYAMVLFPLLHLDLFINAFSCSTLPPFPFHLLPSKHLSFFFFLHFSFSKQKYTGLSLKSCCSAQGATQAYNMYICKTTDTQKRVIFREWTWIRIKGTKCLLSRKKVIFTFHFKFNPATGLLLDKTLLKR